MPLFSIRIDRRASTLLAGATATVLAATAGAAASALGGRFAAWCRDLVAQIERFDFAGVSLATVLAIAAAAFLLSMVRETVSAFRLRRAVARSRLPRSGKVAAALTAIGQPDAPIAVVRDLRPYAYAFGIVSPRVVISSALVSALTLEELKAVLRHELRHLAARHPLRSLLWENGRRAFFFLPALRDLAEHFALAREIEADHAAVVASGRRPLAAAMLKAVAPGVTGVAALVAFGHLQGRIEALHGERGAPLRVDALRAAVTALAIVGTMAAAVPAHADRAPISAGRCRAEFDRQVDAFIAPFTSAFPPGPSSDMADVQSREIGP